ncbi:MAG: PilW family protein [Candidatus Methylomirabilales bacterium]
MDEHRARSKVPQAEMGFTLAETLVAVAISSIVLLGLYLVYDVNQATFVRGEQQTDLQQNARIGMDRLVRELRLAGSDPSETLTTGPPIPGGQARCSNPPPATPQAIENAEATCVRFYADVNADPSVLPEDLETERVEYSFDAAAQLLRRQKWITTGTGGGQPLAERVSGLTFAYFDGTGVCLGGACATPPDPVPTGSLGSIRRIAVVITTADTQTGGGAPPFTLTAEIRPRNLGLNP